MDKRPQALLNRLMLGLGFWEIVIIGLIALIVIGPERLPDFAKSVAKFLNEMKRTAADLKTAFDDEKDIFKENIDQLQKFKNEVQALPDSLKKDTQQKKQESKVDPTIDNIDNQSDMLEHTSVYEEIPPEEYSLNTDQNSSTTSPDQSHSNSSKNSQKGEA